MALLVFILQELQCEELLTSIFNLSRVLFSGVRIMKSKLCILMCIFIIGAIQLNCAGSKKTAQADMEGSDLRSEEEEAFQQQILQLLGEEQPAAAETQTQQSQTDQEQTEIPAQSDQREQPSRETTTAESLYLGAKTQVEQLEGRLGRRNSTIDSLKIILGRMDGEITTMETEVQNQPEMTQAQAYEEAGTALPVPSTIRTTSAGSGEFHAKYDAALKSFNKNNYRTALSEFSSLLRSSPNHVLADNCQYWIAECYYALKEYDEAIAQFLKVYSYRPKDKYDDAQIMIGLAYLKKGDVVRAKKELNSVLLYYPNSQFAQRAQQLINRLK